MLDDLNINPLIPEKMETDKIQKTFKKSVSIVPHTPEKLEEKVRKTFFLLSILSVGHITSNNMTIHQDQISTT